MTDAPYSVGYGKPPKHGQFKPGKSGNPKGRPKAPPKLEDLIAGEAKRMIKIEVAGQPQELSQAHVVVKAVFQRAMKGDLQAAKIVLQLLQALPDAPEAEVEISPDALQMLHELLAKSATGSVGDEV